MALSHDIRSIFQDVTPSRTKRMIAGRPARVILVERGLYILPEGSGELILVEPRIRPRGELYLTYALRDDAALADLLDQLGMSREVPKHEYRRGKPRRLGPT